jgi:tetratricopeptide (TPR) repeat protein
MDSYTETQLMAAHRLEYRTADNDEKGEYDRAIADYTKAIEMCPFSLNAYLERAAIYYMIGDMNSAIEDYSKVIALIAGEAGYVDSSVQP